MSLLFENVWSQGFFSYDSLFKLQISPIDGTMLLLTNNESKKTFTISKHKPFLRVLTAKQNEY